MTDRSAGRRAFEACDFCDEPFEVDDRYPVVVHENEDTVELYSFCDETCKQAWKSERDERR